MTAVSTRQPGLNPPRPVQAAVWCIVAVVVIGLTSGTLIFADGWTSWTDTVLILVGQTITVVIPGLLAVVIYRGSSAARWVYLVLITVGITLRSFGLVDSLSAGEAANAALQSTSIVASASSVLLLLSRPARRFFRASLRPTASGDTRTRRP